MALINCPNCNEKISDKAEKCPYCEHNMSEMMICPECGKWIKKNQENCSECGCPISSIGELNEKSISKKEKTKDVIKDIGVIIKPTSEQKNFLARRKKPLIIIGICIVIALALIISHAIIKSEKEELYKSVWGAWEAYMYEDGDDKMYYEDLSYFDLENVEIELYLNYDKTYYLDLGSLDSDEDIQGTWDITTDGQVKLYVQNEQKVDIELHYYKNIDKLTITMPDSTGDSTFHLKRAED